MKKICSLLKCGKPQEPSEAVFDESIRDIEKNVIAIGSQTSTGKEKKVGQSTSTAVTHTQDGSTSPVPVAVNKENTEDTNNYAMIRKKNGYVKVQLQPNPKPLVPYIPQSSPTSLASPTSTKNLNTSLIPQAGSSIVKRGERLKSDIREATSNFSDFSKVDEEYFDSVFLPTHKDNKTTMFSQDPFFGLVTPSMASTMDSMVQTKNNPSRDTTTNNDVDEFLKEMKRKTSVNENVEKSGNKGGKLVQTGKGGSLPSTFAAATSEKKEGSKGGTEVIEKETKRCSKSKSESKTTSILRRSTSAGIIKLIQYLEGDGGYWYIEPRQVVSDTVSCSTELSKSKSHL